MNAIPRRVVAKRGRGTGGEISDTATLCIRGNPYPGPDHGTELDVAPSRFGLVADSVSSVNSRRLDAVARAPVPYRPSCSRHGPRPPKSDCRVQAGYAEPKRNIVPTYPVMRPPAAIQIASDITDSKPERGLLSVDDRQTLAGV
jgi:hypothetical protein